MKKVLITGSTGFVGNNLSPYLQNREIEVITLLKNELANIKLSNLDNIEVVIHLAGKAHDLKKATNPEEYYQVNFELTEKLYETFLKSNAKKFIFISSVKAIADVVEDVLIEDVTPNPKTDYGKSKLMAEEYIQNQPLPAGKSYFILRPCMIHGPGNKGNLNVLYKFVKKGIPYPMAGFDNQRSFLSVENLCFVINELIIREDIPAGIYNVADDEVLSTNEVIAMLAFSLNLKPRLWELTPSIIKFFAKVGDILHLPLTTERVNKLTENYIVSNQKIKKVLNKNLPLTAIDGLKITARSFNKD